MNLLLTAQFAQQILHSHPSDQSLAAAQLGIADYLACALPIARRALPDSGLDAVLGVFPAHSAENRALYLGYVSHSLDFDDYHPALRGHPSTVVLSTLFALAEQNSDIGGPALLEAYVIGVEAAGRLGLAAGTQHYTLGYHSSATLGAIAATAAGARLLGLSQLETQIALGLAATQAAGLRGQFGSQAKPLHAGLAARIGVNALLLAQAGFGGQPEGVLDGFLEAHGDQKQQPERLIADWGTPWRVLQPGLEFKRYPTCGGTHSAAEAGFLLREQLLAADVPAEQFLSAIRHIQVSFPPGADTAPNIRQPKNGVEARFSLEYVIADALLNGTVALANYSEGPLLPEIDQLAQRVERHADPDAPHDALDPELRFHHLQLSLTDGRQFSARVTRAETRERPTDVLAKFNDILALMPDIDANAVIHDSSLQPAGAISRLTALLFKK